MTGLILAALFGLVCLHQEVLAEEWVVAQPAMQRETLTGFTRAQALLTLAAETSGKVIEVNGDVGDTIGGASPFACLDPTFVDLEIRANQAEIASLQVDVQHFRKQVRRFSQLLKQNSSSESQLDEAQHSLSKTLSQIETLKVQAETLQERRQRHCVTAPEGWRIIKRHVEPGQWVSTGQALADLGYFASLLIPFALTMEEYRALRSQGDHLSLRLPDLNLELPAKLERVSPAFDEASRKIQVELEVGDGLNEPRGGLRAELELEIPLRSGAIALPAAALQERYEEHWLTRADGESVNVVYLGRHNGPGGDWVRVVSPQVKPGDRFLIGKD